MTGTGHVRMHKNLIVKLLSNESYDDQVNLVAMRQSEPNFYTVDIETNKFSGYKGFVCIVLDGNFIFFKDDVDMDIGQGRPFLLANEKEA